MKTLEQVILKDNDRRAIREATDVLRRCFPVERVVLFGSKARGDDDQESDIDLLVLTSQAVTYATKRRMTHALFDLQLSYGVVFSMVVVPLEQWEQGVYRILPIHAEVDRDGAAA